MNIEGKLFLGGGFLQDSQASNYVLQTVLTDIDEGSEFDRIQRDALSTQTPLNLISELGKQGYDVMLGYIEGNIVGHAAFQAHYEGEGVDWRIFRIFIIPENRGRGYSTPLSEELIKRARERGIDYLQLGNRDTKNPKMVRLLEKLKFREDALGVKINGAEHRVNLKP